MNLDIKDDGKLIHLFLDGKFICTLPPAIAREIAHWLIKKAGRIEQLQNIAQTVIDQAILERANTGVGLVADPKILDEAHKEAQWNKDLRRYMPLNGIEPKSIVGLPNLRNSHVQKPN
jgi:hypothetical protein